MFKNGLGGCLLHRYRAFLTREITMRSNQTIFHIINLIYVIILFVKYVFSKIYVARCPHCGKIMNPVNYLIIKGIKLYGAGYYACRFCNHKFYDSGIVFRRLISIKDE